jgi:hemerythrin superfamily protein
MNAIEMLKTDHRHVESLFEQYLSQSRADALRDIVEQLSIHAAIEEQYLYPKIRDVVPNGSQLADEGVEEHQAVKELLSEIDSARDEDAGVRAKVMQLKQNVEHHVSEEESEMFPKLEAHCSAQDLTDLGSKLESAKSLAPTHPHPHAPERPPGNKVAGPAAAVVDRVRDAISGKR